MKRFLLLGLLVFAVNFFAACDNEISCRNIGRHHFENGGSYTSYQRTSVVRRDYSK